MVTKHSYSVQKEFVKIINHSVVYLILNIKETKFDVHREILF